MAPWPPLFLRLWDAEHIHSVLMTQFPQLENCGGYTLLRLNDNSHDLVAIDYPAKGMTVPYLKDILNQAKLYIRPLQKNITDKDMHQVMLTSYLFATAVVKYICSYKYSMHEVIDNNY